MNPILDIVGGIAGKVLDRVLPDPAVREEAKLELARMAQAGELAELEAELRREELSVETERVHQADRDSARQREVDTKDWTPRVLAFGIVGAFTLSMVAVYFFEVPQGSLRSADMLFGALIASLSQVLGYYFGSSTGSANKQRAIERELNERRGGEIQRVPPIPPIRPIPALR